MSFIEDIHCHICSNCLFIKQLCGDTFAVAPLIARDSTIGMIMVDNPDSGRKISKNNLHFLQLFASQSGMAIENSMLYRRVEETNTDLRDTRERLVHGERLAAIGEMTANLVHELKNPLISIGGFAGRLLKALPGETQEHRYANTIVKEVGRLEKMLEETLSFSRKPTICYSQCNLAEIVNESVTHCFNTMEDNGIELAITFSSNPCLVFGDAYQLRQIFLNLILNACDAMFQGGRLTISIEEVFREKRSAVVSIQDSGGGIPQEMLHQVFKPFFTTKRHGTGLGLAIANRIALNHSGLIEVENTETGALFRVVVPLIDESC
jgi:signal transduction histidine kinase